MRNSFMFSVEIENAKKTTAPGAITWVKMFDSGRVEVDHNKTEEQTEKARKEGVMASWIPSRVAALVFVYSDQTLEIIKGARYVSGQSN